MEDYKEEEMRSLKSFWRNYQDSEDLPRVEPPFIFLNGGFFFEKNVI